MSSSKYKTESFGSRFIGRGKLSKQGSFLIEIRFVFVEFRLLLSTVGVLSIGTSVLTFILFFVSDFLASRISVFLFFAG